MKLRDELAEQYYERTGFCPTEYAVMNFHAGFDACEAHYLPMIEKLKWALKFECGNRCSDLNPCNAKEALAELEEFKLKMNGEKNDSTK